MWYTISLKKGWDESKELIEKLAEKMSLSDLEKAEKLANDYLIKRKN